ncbi:hypothetical protein PR003_g14516 [Phytophthora rubi]|uniref:Uncharacterized protein n=1 Tax=Phytophthora rubi TaxID=129364 RepID=A0A6A3LB04_9STRA|nr:hypothetical protein PR001_g14675 [Phytophthora rubi]KAE9016626.1 hypothetical protein PR002_g13613 [Phytophthora rubi]KAE9332440.1 hypothetical protein PR003_g14516 [Phytophthora rubi]
MLTTPSTPASPRPDSPLAAPPTSSTPDAPSDLRGPPPSVAPDSLSDTEAQPPGVPEAPSAAVGDVGAPTEPKPAGTGSSPPDVIVVDDSGPPSSQASPGRASARLQDKKAARVLRAAARKPKRVGPVSGVVLAEARKKKRKAGTPAVPTLSVSTY